MQRSNLLALGLAASLLAATTALAAPGGDVVSGPHSPENGAVNTSDSSAAATTPTPGANSFTQSQARGRIEKAGYTEVSALTKTEQGLWTGTAKKGGQTATVSVDFKGVVTAQ